jgi:hypothetical protein
MSTSAATATCFLPLLLTPPRPPPDCSLSSVDRDRFRLPPPEEIPADASSIEVEAVAFDDIIDQLTRNESDNATSTEILENS